MSRLFADFSFLHSLNDQKAVVYFYGYNNNDGRLWLTGLYDGQVEFGKDLVMNLEVASGGALETLIHKDSPAARGER